MNGAKPVTNWAYYTARPWREHVALATLCALERLAQTRADFPQTPVKLA